MLGILTVVVFAFGPCRSGSPREQGGGRRRLLAVDEHGV